MLPLTAVLSRPVTIGETRFDNILIFIVFGKNRALVDVLRSVAHEMTHMMQDETGLITGPVQDAGGFHEDQANSKAGEIIKLFAKSTPVRKRIYESFERSNLILG